MGRWDRIDRFNKSSTQCSLKLRWTSLTTVSKNRMMRSQPASRAPLDSTFHAEPSRNDQYTPAMDNTASQYRPPSDYIALGTSNQRSLPFSVPRGAPELEGFKAPTDPEYSVYPPEDPARRNGYMKPDNHPMGYYPSMPTPFERQHAQSDRPSGEGMSIGDKARIRDVGPENSSLSRPPPPPSVGQTPYPATNPVSRFPSNRFEIIRTNSQKVTR